MAAHRAAERDSTRRVQRGRRRAPRPGPTTCRAPSSSRRPIAGYQFFVPFIVTSWQKVYGNIYSRRQHGLQGALRGDHREPAAEPDAQLHDAGDHRRAARRQRRNAGAGARRAVPARLPRRRRRPTPTTRSSSTRRRTTCSAGARARKTLLCGGAGDPTVPPAVHMVPMKADFDARGVTTVSTVDVDAQIQAAFGPGGTAPTDPASAAYCHLLRRLPRHLRAALLPRACARACSTRRQVAGHGSRSGRGGALAAGRARLPIRGRRAASRPRSA